MRVYIKLISVAIFISLMQQGAFIYAQTISATDSASVETLLLQSKEALRKKQYSDALQKAKSALEISRRNNWNKGKANALLESGNILAEQKQLNEALNYYLQSLAVHENIKNNKNKFILNMQVASIYQEMKYYDNAYLSYKKASEFTSNETELVSVAEKMAYCTEKSGKTQEAINQYEQLYTKSQKGQSKEVMVRSLVSALRLSMEVKNYDKALDYVARVTPLVSNDGRQVVTYLQVLNLSGIAYLQKNEGSKALQSVLKAQELIKQNNQNQTEAVYESFLNLGYINTFLRDYPLALQNYQNAINWAKSHNNDILHARALNMLATTYVVSNAEVETALSSALQAELLLRGKVNATEDQLDNYLLMSELYQKNNDFEASKVYYQYYQELKSRIEAEHIKQEELIAQNRLMIERKENEIRLLLADEYKQNLETNQSKLEAEQRQNELLLKQKELDILKRNQELQETNLRNQMLEQQRVKQQLLLTNQQLEADQKNREILELQKNKEIQNLELQQRELKEKENQKAIELLESQQKIQNLQIEEQNRNRNLLIGIAGVIGLLSLITTISFLQKRKDNKRLAKQKEEIQNNLGLLLQANAEIQEKNEQLLANEEEIRQNSEEIQATNESLMKTQSQLEKVIAELQSTQDSLVQSEKMASLGQLVAGISHEVNTPLGVAFTAITYAKEFTDKFNEGISSGEKLKKSDLDKFLLNTLESNSIIFDNLKRASELIASFKKVSVDQTQDDRNLFAIKSYLNDIFNSLKPELRKYNIAYEIEGPNDLSLDSYPSAFSQVIINFVMNSIKHGFEDLERSKQIIVHFTEKDGKVILIYSDNGKGIPQEYLSKIFDPFFTTKRNSGGSGLGLHIVFNIITQKLKGTVECTSETDKYTQFTLTLPKTING